MPKELKEKIKEILENNYIEDSPDLILELSSQREKEILVELMRNATILARQTSQVVGEKNDYYITIWQLAELLKELK